MQYSTTPEIRQDELVDIGPQGRPRPWRQHKAAAQLLAAAYEIQGQHKRAARVRACADTLAYTADENGRLHLQAAAFCRVRLCPICQWRRSLKLYGQTRAIITYLTQQAAAAGRKPYIYLMLTLTVPNVTGGHLAACISHLHESWQRLCQLDRVRRAVRGWMRATEITYNTDADTWHPHIHAVLAVPASYCTSRLYIPHAEWLQMWQHATRQPEICQVDIRRTYGSPEAAAAEIAKYSAKPSSYIDASDIDRMDRLLSILDSSLSHRRCASWGGCMADAHRALHLDSAEDGDLVHTGEDEGDAAAGRLLLWDWAPGVRLYLRRHDTKCENDYHQP